MDDRLLGRLNVAGLIDQLLRIVELREELGRKQASQSGGPELLHTDFDSLTKARELARISRAVCSLLQSATSSNKRISPPQKLDVTSIDSTRASLPMLAGSLA